MKVTYKEIWEARAGVQDALKVTGLPLKDAVAFAKMVKAVGAEAETIVEEQNKIINAIGKDIDGKGTIGIIQSSPEAIEFDKQLKDLMTTEVPLDINPITITLQGGDKDPDIPINVLYSFDPFLVIKELKAPDKQNK